VAATPISPRLRGNNHKQRRPLSASFIHPRWKSLHVSPRNPQRRGRHAPHQKRDECPHATLGVSPGPDQIPRHSHRDLDALSAACLPRGALNLSFPRRAPLIAALALVLLPGCGRDESELGSRNANGTLIRAVKSNFSDIRVRENGSVRNLIFVEPSGLETRQSSIDLKRPGRLMLGYSELMFGSFLFKHPQPRVLIVGLGGGAMVRFLNHHFPETRVDAVEIDPVVVALADELFGTRPHPGTRIFTEDALLFLQHDHGKYDAIYMDAFLEPGDDTDPRGIPQKLKTAEFLKGLHRHLTPGGVVAFNIVEHPGLSRDLESISAAFPVVHTAKAPGTGNHVVIASPDPAGRTSENLRAAGRALDAALDPGFSFEMLASLLSPEK
jgi:spermidine synthase